jgi:hypothetical protein
VGRIDLQISEAAPCAKRASKTPLRSPHVHRPTSTRGLRAARRATTVSRTDLGNAGRWFTRPGGPLGLGMASPNDGHIVGALDEGVGVGDEDLDADRRASTRRRGDEVLGRLVEKEWCALDRAPDNAAEAPHLARWYQLLASRASSTASMREIRIDMPRSFPRGAV